MKLPNDISNDRESQNCYWVLFSVTRFLISRTPYSVHPDFYLTIASLEFYLLSRWFLYKFALKVVEKVFLDIPIIPQSPVKAPQNINVQAHDFLSSLSVSDGAVETIDNVSSKSDTIEYSFDKTSDSSLCISFSILGSVSELETT